MRFWVDRPLDHRHLLGLLAERLGQLIVVRRRDGVLTRTLGLVHHVVGDQEDILGRLAVLRVDGNPDRGGRLQRNPVGLVEGKILESLGNAAGNAMRFGLIGLGRITQNSSPP